jgi:hypothetical protein
MTETQTKRLAWLKSCKARSKRVSEAELDEMAKQCRKLAKNTRAHSLVRKEAEELADRVKLLQSKGVPPEGWTKGQIREQTRVVQIRMAHLLVQEFGLLH